MHIDHGGRAAFLGQPPDDRGRASEAEPEPADFRRTDGAHEAGGGQRLRAIGLERRRRDRQRAASGATVPVHTSSRRGGIVYGVWGSCFTSSATTEAKHRSRNASRVASVVARNLRAVSSAQ